MRGALAQIQAQALHDPICHLWGTKIAHYKLLTHISASNSGQSTDVWGWRDTVDFLSRHLSFSLMLQPADPRVPMARKSSPTRGMQGGQPGLTGLSLFIKEHLAESHYVTDSSGHF